MGNTIQIKRGEGIPSTGVLAPYELGYDINNSTLYIGGELVDDDVEKGTKKYGDTRGIGVEKASQLYNGQGEYLTFLQIMNKIYPVGSIYTSTNGDNPQFLFGFGTWEQIQGQFLLAAGITPNTNKEYTAGNSGGAASVALENKQMPPHAHGENVQSYGYKDWTDSFNTGEAYGYAFDYNNNSGAAQYQVKRTEIAKSALVSLYANTDSSGDGEEHENMPPYLVVYMWKRTA